MYYRDKKFTWRRLFFAGPKRLFRSFLHYCFNPLQWLGVHVLEKSFYSPIPDTKSLSEKTWTKESKLVGVEMNEKLQLELLDEVKNNYQKDLLNIPIERPEKPGIYYSKCGFYGPVEGEILYVMVKSIVPKK